MDILKQALALIEEGIREEEIFGDGIGANFIVYENAERMVNQYNDAVAKGLI